ncbi:MAG: TylF/MycF/NovP-related O-methyltransferase [Bacteroidota bacterium]
MKHFTMTKPVLFINIFLGAVFLFYLLRYLWSLFHEGFYRPEEWAEAVRKHRIDATLNKARRKYKDKLRFYSLWLMAEQLRKNKVKGAYAELGVYKGETARILHYLDPDRELHLFDSFIGFSEEDLKGETGDAATYTVKNFADTSLQKVRQFMGTSPKIHFHQGHFPETSKGLEKLSFALVSLDADLYQPTKAGLEFFYPRLNPGGLIFIHDYNYRWAGIQKAVDEFVKENSVCFVLLPDRDGTVVITKQT